VAGAATCLVGIAVIMSRAADRPPACDSSRDLARGGAV
jgi:hypothetical protein